MKNKLTLVFLLGFLYIACGNIYAQTPPPPGDQPPGTVSPDIYDTIPHPGDQPPGWITGYIDSLSIFRASLLNFVRLGAPNEVLNGVPNEVLNGVLSGAPDNVVYEVISIVLSRVSNEALREVLNKVPPEALSEVLSGTPNEMLSVAFSKVLGIAPTEAYSVAYSAVSSGNTDFSTNISSISLIPKSPEVMGFERYGEYPVSEYTGIPSINIPLYTIKIKDFEFPISLDYHAAGIQVTQEAAWAGLGWNLLAGGCISTIPVGATDGVSGLALPSDWTKMLNYNPGSVNAGDPRRFKEDGERLWGGFCYSKDNGVTQTPDNVLLDGLKGAGERDIYRVSLMGKSFDISIHPDTGEIIYSGEKNKFKIEKNGGLSWLLTDERGYIYYFSDIESYKSGGATETPTWYLTKIFYKGLTMPLIEINYQSAYVTYLPSVSEYFSYRTQNNTPIYVDMPTRNFFHYDYYKQLYISSIVGPMDSVVFQSTTRDDLRNAKALDQILIYDKSSKTEIKRYKFEHDYFIGEPQGAGYTTDDYAIKRLRLTKLIEMKGTQTKGSYQFTYNTANLPYKTSFSQDFWGYYNGYNNSTGETINMSKPVGDEALFSPNHTLLPNIDFSGIYKGVIRNSNKNCITAGMLKSITYPTGGKTEFEFEAHRFRDETGSSPVTYTQQSVSKSVINNGNSSFSTPSLSYENLATVNAKITVNILGKDYNSVQAMQPFYVVLSYGNTTKTYSITSENWSQFINNNHSLYIEENITIPIGVVTLSTSVADGMPYQGYVLNNGVQATISYTETVSLVQNGELTGAGVRIKSIKSYTDNNTLSFTKQYNYTLANGQTSGKLLQPIQFMLTGTKYYAKSGATGSLGSGNSNIYYITQLFSGNQFNYAVNGSNALVGYNRVEVKTLSPDGNTSAGTTVSEFDNNSTYSRFDVLFYPVSKQYTNGKLIKKAILNAQGDTLSVEKNAYTVENFEYNLMNVHVIDNYVGPTDVCTQYSAELPTNVYSFNGRFDIIVYPTNSYTVHLTKKEDAIYSGTQKVEKSISYEYDTLNYQIKKQTETINGKNYIKEYKYTLNYGPGDFYAQSPMDSANIISVPIEEFTSVDATPLQSKKTEYFLFNNNNIIAPSDIYLKNGTNAYETRLKYENYDKFGNPLYIIKDDADKVVYLWSYNYQYPIAEIKNATFAEVNAVIYSVFGVADAEALAALATPNEAKLKDGSLQRALPNALVTTYTYKPLVGIATMTDPRGVITWYDYDSFGRLQTIKDMNNNIIENYEYHYKN